MMRALTLLIYLGVNRASDIGRLWPIKSTWTGEKVTANPINGLELSTYSFCIRAEHPAQWLHVKFPDEISELSANQDTLNDTVSIQIDVDSGFEGCFDVDFQIKNPEGLTVTGPFSLWTSNYSDSMMNQPIDLAYSFGSIGFAPNAKTTIENFTVAWDTAWKPDTYNRIREPGVTLAFEFSVQEQMESNDVFSI